MPSIALYYPWMHFQDDNWLKLALLTWDNIVRVRPRSLDGRDGELVRRLRADTDLIVEATPSPTELTMVADTFTEIIEDHRAPIVRTYGGLSRWRRTDRPDPYDAPASQWMPPATNVYVPEPRLVWIYGGDDGAKVGGELRQLLLNADLAVTEPSARHWMGVRPKLGSIYLAALADAMARNNKLSPATDDPRMHDAVGALDRLTELLIGDHVRTPAIADTETAFVHLALRAVIEPDRLADVPVAKLIAFRQRHVAELTAFRAHVAGLATELQAIAAVENLAVAQAHLEALYNTTTKPQLDELRRALRGHGIESGAGAMGLKIDLNPAATTVLGGVAAALGQPVVAGAAVVVTVVPYLASKLKVRRRRLKHSPVAYLLAADRKLAGRSLLKALR